MKTVMKTVIKIIAMGILAVLFLYVYTYQHESAHRQIYLYDGCANASVHWIWQGAYTICGESGESECVESGYRESQQAIFLHSLNEIVGYNVQAVMAAIFIFI